MKPLHLLRSALRDFDTIWTYTAKIWGVDQADTYLTALHNDMERLREYPELGPAHPSRLAGFRKLPSGHHVIFYLVQDDCVEVVRVLHERMDVKRQLDG